MGLGKIIRGVGTAELYHPEPSVFLQRVADTFRLNVNQFYMDGEEQDLSCITFPNTDSISVHASLSENKQLQYDFSLPVQHPTEKTFDFSFYPNNIFDFIHIPYSSSWRFFFEELIGGYGGLKDHLASYLAVRNLYTPIAKHLNFEKLIITTNAGCLWEDELLFSENYEEIYSFDTLTQKISELDNIRFLSLQEVFSGKHTFELKKIYEAKGYYDIAFVDTM